ncbi:hypothetical protein [Flavobacterium sp.]|uniref:hypothetical protein n=1 Tax=Flavobacterium sp. TaxID=239 RepID=UPI00286BC157|nr:hypothetical protein [Flavobacterium sp.]
MKHFKLIYLFFIFSIVLFSCGGDVEPIDPALLIETPTGCAEPSFLNVSAFINGNTVSINWDKTSGDAWEIQYGTHGFAIGSGTVVNFTATSSLIGGLVSTTNYDFYIRTKCDANDHSEWVGPVSPGSSIEVCVEPISITAIRSTTDPTKATVTWSANTSATSWQVQYGAAGFVLGSGTVVASSTPTKIITGLVATTSYNVYVRSNCSANQNSDWVGPIVINAVGATSCTTPTGLTAVRSLNTQALLSWNAGGTETSWEIQYGNVGFAVGSGTTATATTTSKTITGLAATSYDFYVRAICSASQNSAWFGPINIAAVSGGVDNTPALMTANIAGTQFNSMKPYLYSVTGSDVSVLNNGAALGDPRYLWIQGDTSDNLNTLSEIDLYIPDNLWHAGTYDLSEVNNFEDVLYCQVKMLTNPGSAVSTYNQIIGGTITVTEFNLTTKRIKGTFTFSYEKIVDGVSAGTFQVTNGTFNYGLDASYFD